MPLKQWPKIVLFIVLFLGVKPVTNAQSLTVLDISDQKPVEGAFYEYGTSKGISGIDGTLEINYQTGMALRLRHIGYVAVEVQDNEVREAFKTGHIYLERLTRILQPVSVVAIHTPAQSKDALRLQGNDRLNHDGGDILNTIAGFSGIRKSPAFGYDPVFRGYKYEQLNVVIDGVQSAIAACPNRMDPPTSQIAPNMMGHIEVLKGPHSLRFGNSFGATINFLPVEPVSGETGISGRISGRFESNGKVTRNEAMAGFSQEKLNLLLFGSWAKGGDYQTGDGQQVPAGFTRGSAGTRFDWNVTEKQQLGFSVTRNFARNVDFPALAMDLRSDDTWLINAKHKLSAQSKNKWSISSGLYLSLVDHHMDNLGRAINPRTINASTPAKTMSLGGRSEASWKFNSANLYTGIDVKYESAEGTRIREFLAGPNTGKIFRDNAWQSGHITKSALFAEYQYYAGDYRLVFSGRAEINRSGINDPDEDFLKLYNSTEATRLNPSVSMGITREFGPKFFMGAWLGRASRSGSLTERFINYFAVGLDPYELLGNPNLDPEFNNQFDWNISYSGQKGRVSIDIFSAWLQDHISSTIRPDLAPQLPASPGVRQFSNRGDAFKTGFEITASHQITRHLTHILAVAWTYGQDLELNEPLSEVPPLGFRYSLTGNWADPLQTILAFRHVVAQKRFSKTFGERETPGFSVIDLSVSYDLTKKINLNAGLGNILNETYYEHLNRSVAGTPGIPVYQAGRTADVALIVHF